jgi:ribosomal RNA-processing protein 17
LREERKQELEEHVEAVNAILKEVNGVDSDEDDEGAWNGFEDEKAPVEVLDHEEEYVDEDRYTTVTVEAVDVSKEGLQKVVDEDDSDAEAPTLVEAKDDKADDGKKKWPKKPRKKKLRYESKVERKLTRAKQKSNNNKRADARKGD